MVQSGPPGCSGLLDCKETHVVATWDPHDPYRGRGRMCNRLILAHPIRMTNFATTSSNVEGNCTPVSRLRASDRLQLVAEFQRCGHPGSLSSLHGKAVGIDPGLGITTLLGAARACGRPVGHTISRASGQAD